MAYMNVWISKDLKVELAIDNLKWIWVISTKMLFKTVIPQRNQTIKLKQYCMHCYVTLSNVF